jgi:hypothetical protein
MTEIYNHYEDSVKFENCNLGGTYIIETHSSKVRLSSLGAVRMAVEILDNEMRLEASTKKQRFGGRETDKLENLVDYLLRERELNHD